MLGLGLVSKAPPAIISGDLQGIKNIEIVAFAGPLCSLDLDRDGKEEIFFVSEATGWRDEWVGGRWVAYEVLSKRVNMIRSADTLMIASFACSFRAGDEPPPIFVSVGFLDANGDGFLDMVIAEWDEDGLSRMTIYDLSALCRGDDPEIAGLMPDLIWASYEFSWPRVKVESPRGKREYLWVDGEWLEND